MHRHRVVVRVFLAALVGVVVTGSLALTSQGTRRGLGGTIWVANRGSDSIRGFDAATGAEVITINMRPGSQPGDLAYANGKLYVAEEMATPPALAIVDADTNEVLDRIFFAPNSRPHHVHASVGGRLIAVGLFGTDTVAVVDTHDDTLLGPWDSNPDTTSGRIHAAVFSTDGKTLYLANEGSGLVTAMDPLTGTVLWDIPVPGVHELAVTRHGQIFVSQRTLNSLAVIDLASRTWTPVLKLGLPDTMRLSANERLLTVGLRTSPAQLAVVDTEAFAHEIVNLSEPGQPTTIAGHQWTSPNGRYTFAAFEGGTSPGVAVIDHRNEHQVIQRLLYLGRPHGVDHATR